MTRTGPLAGLVLASASPRRRDLLRALGLDVTSVTADVDETPLAGESAVDLVRRLATAKAAAVAGATVVAADTVVEVDGTILGQPADAADARRMLTRLAARTHRVHTGVAVRAGAAAAVEVVTTEVTFGALAPGVIDAYVASGEPVGKAGAYAIQGAAGAFVTDVRGSVSNVIGLPVGTVADLLARVVAAAPAGYPPAPR